jgi:hypothetical protein
MFRGSTVHIFTSAKSAQTSLGNPDFAFSQREWLKGQCTKKRRGLEFFHRNEGLSEHTPDKIDTGRKCVPRS